MKTGPEDRPRYRLTSTATSSQKSGHRQGQNQEGRRLRNDELLNCAFKNFVVQAVIENDPEPIGRGIAKVTAQIVRFKIQQQTVCLPGRHAGQDEINVGVDFRTVGCDQELRNLANQSAFADDQIVCPQDCCLQS